MRQYETLAAQLLAINHQSITFNSFYLAKKKVFNEKIKGTKHHYQVY